MSHRSSPHYRVASHVAARRVDETTIVAELRDGTYFELDPVGSLIWQEIGSGAHLDELVEAVTAAFDVDQESARRDIEAFLADLVERGLVDSVAV